MAQTKPLTLRRQRAKSPSQFATSKQYEYEADVIVDNGIFHLNEPFTYAVPNELQGLIIRGSVVKIPFASKATQGIVLSVRPASQGGLKKIESIASSLAISENLLQLSEKLLERYICQPFDIYRSILPPTSKPQRIDLNPNFPAKAKDSRKANFVRVQPGENPEGLLLARILRETGRRRLIVFPTARQLLLFRDRAVDAGIDFVEYGPHQSVSERKTAYFNAISSDCVLGLRSAIFAPMSEIDEIIVFDEFSDLYQEQKSPYWHLRDVAFERSRIEGCDLFFIGATSSLELFKEISRDEISVVRRRGFPLLGKRTRVHAAPAQYLPVIRSAIKNGSVLVSVAEKNFSNSFLCAKCKNIARCVCGGKIIMAKRDQFRCSFCSTITEEWRCRECSSSAFHMLSTGATKISEELGKSLPGVPIYTSVEGKELPVLEGTGVVVATSGMEPMCMNGYSAIILLNGSELIGRPFIRAEEDVFHRWFRTLHQLARNSEIYSSLPTRHRLTQALITMNPAKYLESELADRIRFSLPPASSVIVIENSSENLSGLARRIRDEFQDVSVNLSHDTHSINVVVPYNREKDVTTSLRALQKVRSLKKLSLLRIEKNPVNL